MRREEPLVDELPEASRRRKKYLRPKEISRLRGELRRLPDAQSEDAAMPSANSSFKPAANHAGKNPLPNAKIRQAQNTEPPMFKTPRTPSSWDFEFTESELALISELPAGKLPNTTGLTDAQYMQRLLGGIEAIHGIPTESAMLSNAKADFGACRKFLKRHPQMKRLLIKRRLAKLCLLDPSLLFHFKAGNAEKWLLGAMGKIQRNAVLGALKVEDGKSALGKFPTTGAMEAHLGMSEKSFSRFVDSQPKKWRKKFRQAMVLWAQTSPAGDFLTGFYFGKLDDCLAPACALRFTKLQAAAITELNRVPSDASISEKMSEKYGVMVPANTIVAHRKWLEESKTKKTCMEQLLQLEDAKKERARSLPGAELVSSLDAIRVSPQVELSKYANFAEFLSKEVHRKGLITLRELAQSSGTNTGTLRNLRINHPALWKNVEAALQEEAALRQEFVKANVSNLAASLKYVLQAACSDSLARCALGVTQAKLTNARNVLPSHPSVQQLENFFHSFDARRVLAFAASLSFFDLLPIGNHVILDTSAQQFASLASKSSSRRHDVIFSPEGNPSAVFVLPQFSASDNAVLNAINSLPAGCEIFFFSTSHEIDRHALKELGASGFGAQVRQTTPMPGSIEKLSLNFVILRKSCNSPALEKMPLLFKPHKFAAPIIGLPSKVDALPRIIKRTALRNPRIAVGVNLPQNNKPTSKH